MIMKKVQKHIHQRERVFWIVSLQRQLIHLQSCSPKDDQSYLSEATISENKGHDMRLELMEVMEVMEIMRMLGMMIMMNDGNKGNDGSNLVIKT